VPGFLDDLSQTSAAQLAVSQEQLKTTKGQLNQKQTQYESDKNARCHQALKTSSYEEHKNINPTRVVGTCQWVLNHKKYREWYKSSRDDLLWISADPGCGKSVLAKSLIENELQSTDTHTVCYFFFKDNEEQDSIATAFCAILHQLFSSRPQLIRYAMTAWNKTGQKLPGDVSELWRIWLAAARDPEAFNVTCVFDALDECKGSEQGKMVRYLTDFFTQILRSSTNRRSRLKFIVTSRPYNDIHRGFTALSSNLPLIQLRGEDENDQISKEIDLVIKARVAKLAADLELSTQTKNQVETKLLNMKHRTYLWLHLALEDIYQTYRRSLRRNQESIKLIPLTVEQAYEKILARITNEDECTVRRILQIIVGARRPLAVKEMAIALGVATSTKLESLDGARVDHEGLGDRIRDWCGLFIFINHSRIYLIHQTAKEYLMREGDLTASQSSWRQCLKLSEVEKEMARICIEFLCLKDVGSAARSLIQRFNTETVIEDALDENNEVESFLSYAAEYWHRHLQKAHLPINDLLMSKILQLYDTTCGLYNQWFAIFWQGFRYWSKKPQMNKIRLAALLGHEKVLELVLPEVRSNVNLADENGQTALGWASTFGHLEVVKLLLVVGADVTAEGGEYTGTALQQASMGGHEQVVQLFLDAGVDVNAGKFGTALSFASASGHEQVVQQLLDSGAGADINVNRGNHGTALKRASMCGHERVVWLLLDAGADVNAGYGNSALWYASGGGFEQVVRLLLDAGADVNARGDCTALQEASGQGHEQMVRLLLSAGAVVDVDNGIDGMALQQAAAGGHEQVVRLLLDAGADINAQDNQGTPLRGASAGGHWQVARLLLDAGADVNAHGGFNGTALRGASAGGHEQVVRLLLDAGADVNGNGRHYGVVLPLTSADGHEQVVRALLDEGTGFSVVNRYHGAVQRALAGGGVYVAERIDSPALLYAAIGGHEQVVEMLLDAGAVVDPKSRQYRRLLQLASAEGMEDVVRLMLRAAGTDVDAGGGCYRTAQRVSGDYKQVRNMSIAANAIKPCSKDDETESSLWYTTDEDSEADV
jgi:ankyrin repeat protein